MKRKRLTNHSERAVAQALRSGLTGSLFDVNRKVGVKDVIDASREEMRSWPSARQRVWWSGHFDFLVTEQSEDDPAFVVEFDGPGHDFPDAERRDRAKNTLCRDAGLPILRISGCGKMLAAYERTCVVEHMARRFVEWSDGDHESFDDFDASHLFPPLVQITMRLVTAVGNLSELASFKNPYSVLEWESHCGGIDFSRQPSQVCAFGLIWLRPQKCRSWSTSGGRVVAAGARRLFSTEKRVSFTWGLPVDDERWDDLAGIRIPRHKPVFSDLPGCCLPTVLEDVAQYLALVEIEDWIRDRLVA